MTSRSETSDTSPAPKRIAVVASLAVSLTNFRFQLLESMARAGHEITAFAPDVDPQVVGALEKIGVRFKQMPMARAEVDPIGDLRTLAYLWRQFRQLSPHVVLPYTMKPVIYAGIAGRLLGVRDRYALITGLGYVFTDAHPSFRLSVIRWVSVLLYRFALGGARRIFAYNDDDAEELRRRRIVRDASKICIVPGSGVDLDRFQKSDPPADEFRFLLIARLLRDKGIAEYVEAARRVRERHPAARFQLLGPFDPNPAAVSPEEIDEWVKEGTIEYLGETRDVRPFLAQCTAFVLPSYREGIPRSILEAMAVGRAIITTDAPGCRETVVDGYNGFLVPTRDPSRLAETMALLVANPESTREMGRRSHELVRQKFDVRAVNKLLMTEMGLDRSFGKSSS